MTRRIFKAILTVTIGILLPAIFLIMGVLYRYFTQNQFDQLKTESQLVAKGITSEGEAYFTTLNAPSIRITWVDENGDVLYDTQTESQTMENHRNREEIREALVDGYGQSSRYSSTLTQQSLYVAERLDDGTVVRLSVTQHSILILLFRMIQPIVVIILMAVVLSIVIAKYTANRIVRPFLALDLEHPMSNDVYDELSPLLRRIDQHQKEIQHQEALLVRRQTEFDTIISKIKEGMILLDRHQTIVSINSAAKELLHIEGDYQGKELLTVTRYLPLVELIQKGFSGQKCEGLLTFNEVTYRALIRPITSNDQLTGVAILLFDVSEQVHAEQLRREFTANVSHELKTPLQVISGYAEILTQRSELDSDVKRFTEKIYRESRRMIQLIEDIINLSQLDETTQLAVEKVDLYQMAEKVIDLLMTKAKAKNVSITLQGQSSILKANPAMIHSILYNLCDNAITYNKEGGQVFVRIKSTNDHTTLEIEDTGIGISKEEQSRIFERFYRVDKSRSKKVGGTGLGLSIVKHALQLHQAKLTIASDLGQGTKITLTF